MTKHNFKRTDTRPKIEHRPTENNRRVSLPAGVSATFRLIDEADNVAVVTNASATVETTDPLELSYTFSAGETDVAGDYEAEFAVEYSDGGTRTFPDVGTIPVTIHPELDADGVVQTGDTRHDVTVGTVDAEVVHTGELSVNGGGPLVHIGAVEPSTPQEGHVWLRTETEITGVLKDEPFVSGNNPIIFDAKHFDDGQYRGLFGSLDNDSIPGVGLWKTADLENWTLVDDNAFEEFAGRNDGFVVGDSFYSLGANYDTDELTLFKGPDPSQLSKAGVITTGEKDAGAFVEDGVLHIFTENVANPNKIRHLTTPLSNLQNPTLQGEVFDSTEPFNGNHTGDVDVIKYGGRYYMFLDNAVGPQPEYKIGVLESDNIYGPWTLLTSDLSGEFGGDFDGVVARRSDADIVGYTESTGDDFTGGGRVHVEINPPGFYRYNGTVWAQVSQQTAVGENGPARRGPSTVPWMLKEDWGDSSLNNRSNAEKGRFISDDDGPIEGFYRPEWTNIGGSNTPTVTNGAVSVPSDGGIRTFNKWAETMARTGVWDIEYQWESNPTSSNVILYILWESADDHIKLDIDNSGQLQLNVVTGGSFTAQPVAYAAPDDTNIHNIKIVRSRDLSGTFNYELWFDGTQQATGSSAADVSPIFMRLNNTSDATFKLGRFEIRSASDR